MYESRIKKIGNTFYVLLKKKFLSNSGIVIFDKQKCLIFYDPQKKEIRIRILEEWPRQFEKEVGVP